MSTQNGTSEWPHPWCETFLEALKESGNVAHSCRVVEMARSRAYQYRAESEAFAEAWDEAEAAAVFTVLVPEAVRRAVEGTDKPIFYQGKQVGVEKQFSDNLLMFLLRSHAPARYNQPVKNEISQGGQIVVDLTPPESADLPEIGSLGDGF